VGIDIVENRDIKKNIIFKKIDAIQYLKKNKKYDLIIIKQSIHFFTNKNINFLLNLVKKNLSPGGKLLIFSLKTKKIKIPVFKKMNVLLKKSLEKDEFIFKLINKNLKNVEKSFFDFKVKISLKKYTRMIRDRFISCLLHLTNKEIEIGASEIEKKYNNQIKFTDTLICLKFTKK
jgi:cyclopropane fatty-acyl-phospholipid synthase-like methyltransferase